MKTAILFLLLSGCAYLDPANQWKPTPPKECEIKVIVDRQFKGCMTRQQMGDWQRQWDDQMRRSQQR